MPEGCYPTCQASTVLSLATKGLYKLLQETLEEEKGCNNCCDRNKDTCLHLAARYGNLETVQMLLIKYPGNYIEQSNKTGKRPLHEAAQNNQVAVTQLLLKNGANVNSLKQGDWTPLMLATEKKNIEILELLIQYKANVLLCNKDGWNALHIAARSGNVDILNFLYKVQPSCLKTTSKNARTPLHSAALNGCKEALEWLLDKGIKADMVDSCGVSPLMDAARMGHVSVCDILLGHGADILHLDNLERTVLHHVTQAGQINMIQWCVDKAVDKITKNPGKAVKVSKKSKFLSRCNSLHLDQLNLTNNLRSISVTNSNIPNISEEGTATNNESETQKSTITYSRTSAANYKKSQLKRSATNAQLKHPEDNKIEGSDNNARIEDQFVNWRSLQGSTALHYAAKESRYLVIRALLKMGADKTVKDNFGRVPVDMTTNDNVHVLLE